MISMVDLAEGWRIHGAEDGELAAGLLQQFLGLPRHREGANPVHEYVPVDARPTAFGHGLEEGLGRRAGLVHVLRIGERQLGGADGFDLGGKDLLTVEQQIDAVRPTDARRRVGLHGGREGGILDGDLGEHDRGWGPDAGDYRHCQGRDDREGAEPTCDSCRRRPVARFHGRRWDRPLHLPFPASAHPGWW